MKINHQKKLGYTRKNIPWKIKTVHASLTTRQKPKLIEAWHKYGLRYLSRNCWC